ncbi:hypothetical protein EYF80_029694 [Liparis tanakae]|uniref:Uncharacterized protein n=1 Tax=Liparis tanakae TaxID=230148 RepID=A0A4Z2H5E3_9TELE|nr:hypothetical protein EYF80_029694 [Liparis tanakae]
MSRERREREAGESGVKRVGAAYPLGWCAPSSPTSHPACQQVRGAWDALEAGGEAALSFESAEEAGCSVSVLARSLNNRKSLVLLPVTMVRVHEEPQQVPGRTPAAVARSCTLIVNLNLDAAPICDGPSQTPGALGPAAGHTGCPRESSGEVVWRPRGSPRLRVVATRTPLSKQSQMRPHQNPEEALHSERSRPEENAIKLTRLHLKLKEDSEDSAIVTAVARRSPSRPAVQTGAEATSGGGGGVRRGSLAVCEVTAEACRGRADGLIKALGPRLWPRRSATLADTPSLTLHSGHHRRGGERERQTTPSSSLANLRPSARRVIQDHKDQPSSADPASTTPQGSW